MNTLRLRLKKIEDLSIGKVAAIAILLICIILIVINQQELQFYFNNFQRIFQKDLQVFYLDVGQASSTLLIFPNNTTVMIDTGGADSADSLVKQTKLLLSKNRLSDIDFLILTHSDADHVGGAVKVLNSFQVDNIFRPKIRSFDESPVDAEESLKTVTTQIYSDAIHAIYKEPDCSVSFVEDKTLVFGTHSFLKIFAPERIDYVDTNSFSPFILASFGNKNFLFTGDATSARENEFLQEIESGGKISVDFLQVAHHGSKYSSTVEFLNEILPKYAFISAGDKLHPAQEVIARLNVVGVKEIFVTKQVGTIAVGMTEDGNFVICDLSEKFDVPLLVIVIMLAIFIILKNPYKKSARNIRLKSL